MFFRKQMPPLFTVVNLKRSTSSSSLPSPFVVPNFREVCCLTKYICAATSSTTWSSVDLWYNLFFAFTCSFCPADSFSIIQTCGFVILSIYPLQGEKCSQSPLWFWVPFSKADLDIFFQYEFMALWVGSLTKISIYFNLLLRITHEQTPDPNLPQVFSLGVLELVQNKWWTNSP